MGATHAPNTFHQASLHVGSFFMIGRSCVLSPRRDARTGATDYARCQAKMCIIQAILLLPPMDAGIINVHGTTTVKNPALPSTRISHLEQETLSVE